MKKALATVAALFLAAGAPYSVSADLNVGFAAQAQNNTVTGVVKDTKGEPLIGATVMVKGTTRGISTDIDGRFSVQAAQGSVLQISYVGMKTKTVKVAGNNIDVTLEGTGTELEDLVVVGYGQQKKINLTGAVASVDVDKTLQGRQIPDVGRGLQGTTPGLNIVMPNGEVGSDPTIMIRGQIGSLQGSAQPLILMDNVEIPSIQIVNPDDVESISVLKDAAASSIYGSKAAFGVILITTKKGAKTESVNVTYSGNFAWQNIAKKMEMGGVDAMQYRVDAMKRVGATLYGAFWYVDEASLAAAREWEATYGGKIGKNDPFVYGRDWYVNSEGQKFSKRIFDPYDYMIREWAPSMTHNLSVNGKSGKTTYNIGLGYLDQSGLIAPSKKDDFRRYNASVRLATEINKYVTVHAGMTYSMRNKRYAYATNSTTADPWLYLYRWDTSYPMGYDDQGRDMRSPYNEMKNANIANKQNTYLSFNAGLTANITKDWHVNIDYTYAQEDQVWKKNGTRFTMCDTWSAPILRNNEDGTQMYVDNTGAVVPAGAPGAMPAYQLAYRQYTANGNNPDHIRREVSNAKRHTWNITTDYNWDINEANNLKFLVGANIVDWESEDSWSQITYLTDIVNPSWDKTAGTQTASGNMYWDGQVGFFGRVNYSLFDKYLIEGNIRRDATSKFPEHLRWRWFPSFSAGWRLSEEAFMSWAKPALQAAKVRASWGKIGDQSVASSLYIPTMSQSQLSWLVGGKKLIGVGSPAATLSDLTWQDITTTDIGLDLSFFDGRIATTFDWYQRETQNMIVPMEGVPATFGTGAPKGNFGNLRTRGWEFQLNLNHRFANGLGVNATFTLSDAKTKITEYGSGTNVDSWYNGKTYGELWGYEVDRLYQKDDFVYDSEGNMVTTWAKNGHEVAAGVEGAKKVNKLKDPNAVYQDRFQGGNFLFGPGDVKYKDLDGNGDIYNGVDMKVLNGRIITDPNDPDWDNKDAKVVGTNTTLNHGDRKVIGNTTPRYEYGIRLGLDYKGFDFSIFGQGIGSRKIWGSSFLAIPGFNCGDGAMPQAIVEDYWTENNTNAFYPAAFNMGGSDTGYNLQVSDRYALNMAYFRIKNITLGYTLPVELTRKAYISKCRIYVASENVVTFDKLRGLPIDPEVISGVSMFNSGNYNMGRTGVGTPAMRNISVGIQLNF